MSATTVYPAAGTPGRPASQPPTLAELRQLVRASLPTAAVAYVVAYAAPTGGETGRRVYLDRDDAYDFAERRQAAGDAYAFVFPARFVISHDRAA